MGLTFDSGDYLLRRLWKMMNRQIAVIIRSRYGDMRVDCAIVTYDVFFNFACNIILFRDYREVAHRRRSIEWTHC